MGATRPVNLFPIILREGEAAEIQEWKPGDGCDSCKMSPPMAPCSPFYGVETMTVASHVLVKMIRTWTQ
ncbi:hypothetical protein AAFF_G00213420, partial [Aldrovandia affinis]